MARTKKDFNPNAAATPGSGIFGLPFTEAESKVVIIPAPWEATTSYGGGTANGPEAVRKASLQVDLFDQTTGNPYEAGIFLADEPEGMADLNSVCKERAKGIIEVGGNIGRSKTLKRDLEAVNRMGSWVNARIKKEVGARLKRGKIVGLLGGDHSVSFGAIEAHAQKHRGMGILHIDAHADLRDAFEGFTWSHASIMRNVMTRLKGVDKLVQVGIRDFCEEEDVFISANGRIVLYSDERLAAGLHGGDRWLDYCQDIASQLPEKVYISFDIDGLDPTLCPHTGTPVPGGLTFQQVVTLLSVVADSRRIVGFDLTEVAPGPDGKEWDANVGARILYKLIGYSLKSQECHGK